MRTTKYILAAVLGGAVIVVGTVLMVAGVDWLGETYGTDASKGALALFTLSFCVLMWVLISRK